MAVLPEQAPYYHVSSSVSSKTEAADHAQERFPHVNVSSSVLSTVTILILFASVDGDRIKKKWGWASSSFPPYYFEDIEVDGENVQACAAVWIIVFASPEGCQVKLAVERCAQFLIFSSPQAHYSGAAPFGKVIAF